MSAENKAVMQRIFEEAWNEGNLSVLDEIIAPDFVNHDPFIPGLPPGPEGLKPIFSALRAAFPDLHYTIEELMADGDKVVTRWAFRGTHQGELRGMPPTGREVSITGNQIERFVDGKVVEHWRQSDTLGMLQQLGVIPSEG